MTAWMTGMAAAAFLAAGAASAGAACQIHQIEGSGVERCVHQASFRSGPTAPPRAMPHQGLPHGGGHSGAHHPGHHHGGVVFGGPVVYGPDYLEPDYLVVPTPRYVVNQGPVLGGPGLDPPPYVVYRDVYGYQAAAVAGWGVVPGYTYDGGPYAHPMRHTYDPTRVLPPAIIKLAPRQGVYDMRPHPHRPLKKGKMIRTRADML